MLLSSVVIILIYRYSIFLWIRDTSN